MTAVGASDTHHPVVRQGGEDLVELEVQRFLNAEHIRVLTFQKAESAALAEAPIDWARRPPCRTGR